MDYFRLPGRPLVASLVDLRVCLCFLAVSLLFPQRLQGWCYVIVYHLFKVFLYCFLLRTRLRICLRAVCLLSCPSTYPGNVGIKPKRYWFILSWGGSNLSRLLSLNLSRFALDSIRTHQRIINRFDLIRFSSSRLLGSVRFMSPRKYKPVAELSFFVW